MEQYIPKSVVLDELKKRRDAALTRQRNLKAIGQESVINEMIANELNKIISLINNLKVKGVDLDYIKDELDKAVKIYKPDGNFGWGTLYNIATHFFELGLKAQKEEPVSEELEEAAKRYATEGDEISGLYIIDVEADAFKAGAEWQIANLMKDATEVTVHIEAGNYPYIPQMELYDYDKDVPLAKEGDKYKVVLIKKN